MVIDNIYSRAAKLKNSLIETNDEWDLLEKRIFVA